MTKRLYLILTLSALCIYSNAQTGFVKRADRFMSLFRFNQAAAFYKKAVDADANDIAALEKLGQSFVYMKDFQSAEAVYKTLSDNPLSSYEAKFKYAQMLRMNGKYEEAQKAYNAFAKAMPMDTRSDDFLNFSEQLSSLTQDFKNYELINVPENSAASEIGPAYLLGKLTFSSNRKGSNAVKLTDNWTENPYYDVYTMQQTTTGTNAIPSKAKGKVNRRLNEGPVCFSAEGKEMIFTASNYKRRGEDGVRKLGLYSANYDDKRKKWVNVKPLSFNSSVYNVAQPSLSADGSRLFFVSDMPGGQGGTDIYMSLRNGNTWENPINLGKEINTAGMEMFPFISPSGRLYFSSDSRIGLGGLDILYAINDNGKWGKIVNPGVPINSSSDDFGYICDATGKEGYMVSDRPGGLGSDDIYKFVKNSESICGKVADAVTKKALQNVTITALSDNGMKISARSDNSGTYCFELPVGNTFRFMSDAEGYASFESAVTVSPENNPPQDLFLFPRGGIDLTVDVLEKSGGKISDANAFLVNKKTGQVVQGKTDIQGQVHFDLYKDQEYDVKVVKKTANKDSVYSKFVKAISTMGLKSNQSISEVAELNKYDSKYVFDLPNIFFDYNKYDLNEKAKIELDKVVAVMKDFPEVEVELSAHTDSRGSAPTNLKLSAMRAQSCVGYLESKGVNLTKLIAVGFGEMKIRNKCIDYVPYTDKEHAFNRRIEFKVLSID